MPQLLKWLGSCVQVHPCAQRGARHDCPPHLRPPPKTSDWLVLCSQSGTDSVPEPRPSCSPHALRTAALGIATAASEWLTLVASDLRSERKRGVLHGRGRLCDNLCDGQPALVSDTRHGEPAALVATLVAAHEHPPEPVPRSSAMYSLSVSKAGRNKSGSQQHCILLNAKEHELGEQTPDGHERQPQVADEGCGKSHIQGCSKIVPRTTSAEERELGVAGGTGARWSC